MALRFSGERRRELFSLGLLADLARDLSYTLRMLRRTPLFFAGTSFVLALGIGANCAIFNLVYAVLLKPLPYQRPEEVVMLSETRQHATTSKKIGQWRGRSAGVLSDLAVLK